MISLVVLINIDNFLRAVLSLRSKGSLKKVALLRLKELEYQIEKLRKQLYGMIEQNHALILEEVVSVSQQLDLLLNEYHSKRTQFILI
ncbi:aspartyl-phosphate phosphatase Spo0E family protein [Anaerosolibacter carboniphilus]|uniref:aspartyl-phosphate phosphatase Spo0E family protein n=1 Tax=Anaerosolibacter carboniphilus TaxID=1417629 RepID=UPI00160F8541|nr:aspartyl-phosphate phosphatase Spo0E family protein [Anaerosolibacter carboniphilus]